MDKNKTYRLVYIEWEDSCGCSSDWETLLSETKAKPLVCSSVGWLIQDDSKCKVVVPHLTRVGSPTAEQQGCGDMTIPTAAVVRIINLKIPKR